jgi:release factor glutamine methyltransferase
MTDARTIEEVAHALEKIAGANARAEAQALVSSVADLPVARAHAELERMVTARIEGTPLSYVLGRVQFLGMELLAQPGALIPRAETELLAKEAIAIAQGIASPTIVDMCCGSGNLACAVALHIPTARIWASDLTAGATQLAQRNVARLSLGDRVTVRQGDLFAPLADDGLAGRVDLIVCNPPYISTGKLDGTQAHLLKTEPREAFDGGAYGLAIHQRVLKQAAEFLAPHGWLLFEIGLGQERQVQILFERARTFDEPRSACDADGNARVVMGRKKE